ncbi:GIY-YIG nuclease family protein [Alicyclobacillus dauci]|uniref:GIY-YIG nuclease family protein n=1 Tax=Alicyclobacillus dauci TaxID=1475485 RepID=A0ABY6Z555_9BACL|nr:GIY-YIG nuclease family protein [Alicyclobacillus dauci]WAH37884.1 GIY-YIG nuclease family protein [Alicyclobacillus dauci]
MGEPSLFYVYIVECADETLYTGYTADLEERLATHNAGKGAKYTRGRTPVRLLHTETFLDKSDALRRELAIKKLSRQQKYRLIDLGKRGSVPNKSTSHE